METKGFQFSTQVPTGLTEKTAAALNLLADGVQLTNCINAFLADYGNNIDEEEKNCAVEGFLSLLRSMVSESIEDTFFDIVPITNGEGLI